MSSFELGGDLVITFLVAALILYNYGNWYRHHIILTISVLVAFYFSLIIITVIPLDISNTIYRQCLNGSDIVNSTCLPPSSYLADGVLEKLWRIVYWTSQVLTWLILPMMQSYSRAGEFSIRGKLKAALLDNIIYYASYLFICIILLIYIALKPELNLTWNGLKAIASSASNTWGLFLLVFMLGYGLVAVPRSLWNKSYRGHSLNRAYFKMSKLAGERNGAEEALDDALETLSSYMKVEGGEGEIRRGLETIVKEVPVEMIEKMKRRRIESSLSLPTEKNLIKLHRECKLALQNYHRTEVEWMSHVDRTIYLEDVERNSKSNSRVFKRSREGSRWKINPKIEWYWECMLSSLCLKLVGICLSIMSLFVIWSEATFFIRSPPISLFAIFLNSSRGSYLWIELVSLLTIAYLSATAYYTIFKIRLFNYYYLAPRHQTDEYSLIFAGMLLCRLTPPICLNFLGMVHMDSHVIGRRGEETEYTQIMGHLDVLSIISDGFNIYFPMGILIISTLTYFRVGSRVLNILGFQQFLVEDEVTTELVTDGIQLLSREKRRRERQEEAAERRQKYSRTDNNLREVREDGRGVTSSEPIIVHEQASYGTPQRNPPRDLFDDV